MQYYFYFISQIKNYKILS